MSDPRRGRPQVGAGRRHVIRRAAGGAGSPLRESENTWLISLVLLALAMMVMSIWLSDQWPPSSYVIVLVLAMSSLSIGRLLALDAVIAACVAVSAASAHMILLRWVSVAVVAIVGIIVLVYALSRARLGVASSRGESMLIDLRDRLSSQSQLPSLPPEWHAEAVMRSAGGAKFAGDFVVAAKTHQDRMFEVVVVDVSGKGINAGTRALLLSGAFGGLLGALPPEDFLPAANEYLLRQEWSEGFATAIHLAVNLKRNTFEVRSAGHPPAVQLHAGSGRWTVHWTEGPVLGLVSDAEFTVLRGSLLPGDALMMYTDGLVETPQRDIVYGIDKLVGEAERLVPQGFAEGAMRLVQSVDSDGDDRALFLLRRG